MINNIILIIIINIIIYVNGAVPDKPSTPTLSSISGSSITIEWTEPNANGATITGYKVRISPDENMIFEYLLPDQSTSLSRTLELLDPGTNYYADVIATSNEGDSPRSDLAGPFQTLKNKPDQPNTPIYVSKTSFTVTLKYTALAANDLALDGATVTGYRILASKDVGMTNAVATDVQYTNVLNSPEERQMIVFNLDANTDYYFTLTFLTSDTETEENSDPSNPTSAIKTLGYPIKPEKPTVNVTATTATSLTVNFLSTTSNGATITGYEVRIATSISGPWTAHIDTDPNNFIRKFTNLLPNTQYYFDVKAIVNPTTGTDSERSDVSDPYTTKSRPDKCEPPRQSRIPTMRTQTTLGFDIQTTNPSNANIFGYRIRLRDTSDVVISTKDITNPYVSIEFTSLTSNTGYKASVRAIVVDSNIDEDGLWSDDSEIIYTINPTLSNSFSTGPTVPALPPKDFYVTNNKVTQGITPQQVTFDFHSLNDGNLWASILILNENPNIAFIKAGTNSLCTPIANFQTNALELHQLILESCNLIIGQQYKLVTYIESSSTTGEIKEKEFYVSSNYITKLPFRTYDGDSLFVTYQTSTNNGLSYGMLVRSSRADRVTITDLKRQTFDGESVCGWSAETLVTSGLNNTHDLSDCSDLANEFLSIIIYIEVNNQNNTLGFVQHTSPSDELTNMIISLPFTPSFQSNITSYDLGDVEDVNKTFDITLTFDPLAIVKIGKINEETLINNNELKSLTLTTGPNTIRILVDAANEITTYTITAFLQPATSSYDAAKIAYTLDGTYGVLGEDDFRDEIIAVLSSSYSITRSQIEITSKTTTSIEFLIYPPLPNNGLNSWSGGGVRQTLSTLSSTFSSPILSTRTVTTLDTITAVDLCAKTEENNVFVYSPNWKLKGQCTVDEKLYCFTSPCLNGAQCTIRTNTFVVDCECQKKFFGSYCEIAVGNIIDESLVLNSTVSGNVTLNATTTEDIGTRTNDGLLIINGTHVKFQANLRGGKNIKVYYGPLDDRTRFQCDIINIYPSLDITTPVPSEELSNKYWVDCLIENSFGGNLFFTLEMDDIRDKGTFIVNGPTSYGNNIRYPRPIIIPKTLRVDGSSVVILGNNDYATVTGTSLLGETLVFEGKYFDPTSSFLRIKFSQLGSNTIVFCDVVVDESTATTIKCDLNAGSGADYNFVIDYGQESERSKDEFEYPVPPSITKIESTSIATGGCKTVENYVENCPTNALDDNNNPVVLTISGDKLFDPISITVGGSECQDLTFITLGTKITCKLPVGAGFRQIISAVSRGLISDPVTLVSYARPSILTISGCSPDTSYVLNKGIKDCNRFGNDILTMTGKNFGPGIPFVLVGSSICKNVATINQHFAVKCSLPPGTSLSRSVLLVQDAGVVNTDVTASTVSYEQCLPGQYGDGFFCRDCNVGKITSAKSQLECRKCQVGKYQNEQGKSICKSCEVGKYQNLEGQDTCRFCAPGSYNPATGQGICPTCLGGEFSNTTGFTECYDCPAGSFCNDNATVCTLCQPGTFAERVKSEECTETLPGEFSDIQGARVAEQCPPGQFQPKKNSTTCEDCPLGKYSDESGRELCFDCKDQFYQDELGKTKCKSCQTDGVNCISTYVETLPNYWLYRDEKGVIAFTCPEGICLGENRCADHREPFDVNPMCAHCREKYSEWGGLCTWCDGTHSEFIFLFLAQIFLLTLIIHLILQPDRHDSRHYTSENILKIFFYFIQVALLIVGRALPESLYWLHYFMLNVGKATAAWNVCYMAWDGLQLLTLELFTPAIYWAALAVIMLIHRIIHEFEQRKRIADGRHRKKFRRTPYTLSALSLYLLTYQLVSSAVFRFYDCKTILGDRVVFSVPSISCNSEEYDGLKFFYALVGIVWVGALPLLMIAVMIYYTHGKNDIRVNKLVFELVSKKLQLLYGSWHSNAYFWEGVILLRRMLYSGFDVIYSAELEQKFLAFVLISLASLTHHYVIRPPKPAEMKKKRPKREELRELRHETHKRRASIVDTAETDDGDTGRRKSIFGRRFSGVFVSKARERSVSRDWSNMSGSFASLAMLQMKTSKGDDFVNNLMHLNTDDKLEEEESITINDEKDGNTEPGLQEGNVPGWYDDEVAREAQKQELIIQIQRLKKEIRRIEHGGRFEAPMPVRLAVPRIFTKREQFLFGTRIIYLAVERDQLMVRVGGGYRREEDFLAKWAAQEARILGVSPADVAHSVTKIEHSKAAAEDEVKRKLKKLARGRFMRRHALLERLYEEVDLREHQIDGLDDNRLKEKYRAKAEAKAEAEAAAERRRKRRERRRKEAEARRLERERRLKELADKEEAFDKEWEDHWRKHRLVGIRAHKSHGPFRRPLENYLETLSLAFLLLIAVLRTAFKPPLPDSMIVMMSFLLLLIATGLLLLASRRGLAALYNHLLKRYEDYKEEKKKTGDDLDNVELLKLSSPANVSKKPDDIDDNKEPQLISSQPNDGGEDSKFGSISDLGGVKGEPGNKAGGLFGGILMQQSTFSSVPEEDEEKAARKAVEKLQALQEEEEDDDDDDDELSSVSSLPSQLPDIPTNETGSALSAVQQAYSLSESSKKKKKKKKKKARKKSTSTRNENQQETWSNFVDPKINPKRTDGSASVTLPGPYDTVHQIDDYIRRLHDTEGQQPLLRLPTELGGAASTALGMKAAIHLQELEAAKSKKKRGRRASMPTVVHLPHHEFHFQEHPEQTGRMSRRKSSVDSAGSANNSRRNSMDDAPSEQVLSLFQEKKKTKKKKKRKIKRKLRKKRSKFLDDDLEYKYSGGYEPQETNDGYDSDPEFGESMNRYRGQFNFENKSNDDDDDDFDEIHSDPEIGEPGMPSTGGTKKKRRKFKKKIKKKKKKASTPKKKSKSKKGSTSLNEGEKANIEPINFQRLDTFENLSPPKQEKERQDTFEPLESIMKQPKVINSDEESDDEEQTLEQLTARSKRRIRWDTPSTTVEDEKTATATVPTTDSTASAPANVAPKVDEKTRRTSRSVNRLLEMSNSRFGLSSPPSNESTNDEPKPVESSSKPTTSSTDNATPRRASMVDRLLQMSYDRHENEKKSNE